VNSHWEPRILVSQRSSAVLRPFVRAYAQRMMFVDAPPQAFPPRLEPGLGFEFGLPIEIHSEGRPVVVSLRIALVADTQGRERSCFSREALSPFVCSSGPPVSRNCSACQWLC
jgi:hypothetical protein